MKAFAVGFVRFWRDFIIGDDWRIAASVTGVLVVGAVLVVATSLSDGVIAIGSGLAIVIAVFANLAQSARAANR